METIDLHVHSTKSDGSCTPTELVSNAISKGLSAFALTDHDTIAGIEEAIEAAKGLPLEVIPGIEFSTEYEGRDIHMLGLFIDYKNPHFIQYLQQFQDSRTLRNQKMCAKLREYNIDITYEDLMNFFPNAVITRAHYAQYLLHHNYVKSLAEAFDRYVGDYAPCFLPREKVSPIEAIDIIKQAGGIPVLAHPVLYHFSDRKLEALVKELSEHGLVGIEAVYSTYATAEERQMRHLASKYNLLISGGSDFHGNAKPNLQLGTGYGKLFIPYEILEKLKLYLYAQHDFSGQIIFSDMDFTLLTDDKKITPYLKEALSIFVKNGGRLVLSSGRPLDSILETKEKLLLDLPNMYVIAYNGALVYDCKNECPLYERTVSFEDIETIYKLALSRSLHVQTYQNGTIISPSLSPELEFYTEHIHLPYEIVPDIISGVKEQPYKMLAINIKEQENPMLLSFGQEVEEATNHRIHTFMSAKQYLECCNLEASKGNAIEFLCNYLNIPVANSIAIGDAGNDISMLKAAGIGICMQNGVSEAKEAADLITIFDNNHDGFIYALDLLLNN